MQETHCPLCYEPLEVRPGSPCMDCGCFHNSVDLAGSGKMTYAEFEVFEKFRIVFCTSCQVEFGCYDPAFFGLPATAKLGMNARNGWSFVRDVPARVAKDKCCTKCGYRLTFSKFVIKARALHGDLQTHE